MPASARASATVRAEDEAVAAESLCKVLGRGGRVRLGECLACFDLRPGITESGLHLLLKILLLAKKTLKREYYVLRVMQEDDGCQVHFKGRQNIR